jgi:hypothetical protein
MKAVKLYNCIFTCLDWRPEDCFVSHITWNRKPVNRRDLVDAFWLSLVLLLNRVINDFLFFVKFSKNRLSSCYEFASSLVWLIIFLFVIRSIFLILDNIPDTLSMLIPFECLTLRHSAVTLAKFLPYTFSA